MEAKHLILIYFAAITVVTFFAYGIDKWKAKLKIRLFRPATPIFTRKFIIYG